MNSEFGIICDPQIHIEFRRGTVHPSQIAPAIFNARKYHE